MSFAVGSGIPLSQPPRWVPLSVRVKLEFGGGLNQVGWIVLGIGSALAWLLQIPQATYEFAMFWGPIESTQAVVLSVDDANAEVNNRKVYIYSFEAKIGDKTYPGHAYETGKSLHPGQRVAAEYPADRPDLVRLRDQRSTIFSWPAMFFAAVPIVGFLMVLSGFRRGRRWVKLLGQGVQTTGKLIQRKATGTRINEQAVYKLTFEFRTQIDQICQATVKTHQTERLQDDAEESIFYLPEKPSIVTLLDHLPGNPEVDQMGEFRLAHPFRAWFSLLMPMLVVTGNAAWIYYRYFAQ